MISVRNSIYAVEFNLSALLNRLQCSLHNELCSLWNHQRKKVLLKRNGPHAICGSLEMSWRLGPLSTRIFVTCAILLLSTMMNVDANISTISSNYNLYSEKLWTHFSEVHAEFSSNSPWNVQQEILICNLRIVLAPSLCVYLPYMCWSKHKNKPTWNRTHFGHSASQWHFVEKICFCT